MDSGKYKIETKLTHYISYKDFERLVMDVYGKEYSFITGQEMGNDSDWATNVDDELSDDDMEDLEIWDVSYNAGTILNDLCRRGVIEAGAWVVQVSW